MSYDLLLHVDANDPAVLNLAFNNAANYAKALPGESFRMILVANGPAVALFTRESPLAAREAEMAGLGLDIRLCRNALDAFHIAADALWETCAVVPAGVLEIVLLQNQGFAYVKP